EVAVHEVVPPVSGRDRRAVRLQDLRQPDQRREHREVARDGVVEARQQSVDRSDGISRTDEETGESLSRSHPVRRPGRLERADDGGPMAMTRCPPSRVRLTRSAAAAETSNGSGYTACASTWSVSISRLLTPE